MEFILSLGETTCSLNISAHKNVRGRRVGQEVSDSTRIPTQLPALSQ